MPKQSSIGARLLAGINSARVRGRGALAEIAGLYGGEGQAPATQAGLHRATSRNLTSKLGTVLPPHMAASVADVAGLGNEALSGGLQALLGNPVMSETGFDWADIANNRSGQDEAIRELEANPRPIARAVGTLDPGSMIMEAIASRRLPRSR